MNIKSTAFSLRLKKLSLMLFVCVCFFLTEGLSQSVSFTNQSSLLSNTDFNSGVAIGIADMNGDQLDDIIRFNQGTNLYIEYQQAPNAAFSTYNFGSVNSSSEWSMCVADADQNGYNDILVGGSYDNIKLIKANADGSAYTSSILPNSNIFLQGSNFVDINNDGLIDIFACHDDAESRKYRNTGGGNFVFDASMFDATTTPASDNSGNYASIWTDYDNDGDLDMYLSKCRGGVSDPTDPRRINMLFENDGNNNYSEVAAQANLKLGDQSWSADFADIDNDGDMDCFILNHYTPSLLFENDGNGVFTDITATSGMASNLNFFGIQAIFRDFNNDGFVDLLISGTEDRLFLNDGDKSFTEVVDPFTADDMESFAIGDLNNDGYLDIYAGYANLFTSPSNIDDILFMNDGGSNNYFGTNLVGTTSNINGIGARVELYGSWGIQIREVRSGEGYGIMNSFNQHFGLGSATQISKLVIKWPSGTVDEINNPNINQTLSVTEGSSPALQDQTINFPAIPDQLTTNAPFDLSASASSGLAVSFSIVSGPASISGNTITLTGGTGTVVVQASQAGNANYNPAPNVTQSFAVTDPGNNCNCSIIPLTTDMIFDESTNSNTYYQNGPGSLVDEQSNAGDPVCATGNLGANQAWYLPWGASYAYIDLGQEYSIYGVALLDGSGIGDFGVASGTPGNWDNNFIDYNTQLYNQWQAFTGLSITTRYLRLSKGGSDAKINEIRICGTPLSGPQDQTINFPAIADKFTTSPDFDLNATASSGLTVSYSIVSGPATIYGNTISLDGTEGTVVVKASQAGNLNYNPAPEVEQSFDVSVATGLDQTISFANIPDKLTVSPDFTINATASSGLAVSFSIISGPATISGNTISLNGTEGTVVVRASQAGNASYNPAPNIEQSFQVTEPSGNCDCTIIPLTTDMIFDEASNSNNYYVHGPGSLADEQATAGDPICDDGDLSPNDDWYLPWGQAYAYIDLGQDYDIFGIAVLDGSGIGEFGIATGSPNNWDAEIINYTTEKYNQWESFTNLGVTTRYIRLRKGGSDAKIKEIRICGTIPNGGPSDQTINFATLSDKLTTDPDFDITATASSGLDVSFSIVSGPATISGNTISLDGTVGTVVVKASQAGDPNYNPAPDVEQSFNVTAPTLLDQTISFAALADKLTTDPDFDINATASSGLNVSFSIVSGPATISGNTISLDGTVGTVVVRASQAGDASYNPAPDVEQSFNVTAPALLDQTISFAALADKLTTDPDFDINATASSGLSVSFSIVSGPATISGNTISLNGIEGTVVIRASQAGDASYNPAPDVEQSFNVTAPTLLDQTISFAALADKLTTDPDFDINATASSGLSVSFSIVSGPATISGNTISLNGTEGTVVVRASQAGDASYNPAPEVEQSFDVTVPNTNPPTGYCTAEGNNQNYEYIQSVVFGSINNNSGNDGGYGDYTNLSTNLDAGNSYAINLNPGFPGQSYNEVWRVWIDYNRDGDFDEADELVFSGQGTGNVTGNINVPSTSSNGATRMRVVMRWNSTPVPCGNFTYGEVEDYIVNISGGTSNGGSPRIVYTSANENTRLELDIYPNPVKDILNVSYTIDKNLPAEVHIANAQGIIVKSIQVGYGVGKHRFTLDLGELPTGYYTLYIKAEGSITRTKAFIKIRD